MRQLYTLLTLVLLVTGFSPELNAQNFELKGTLVDSTGTGLPGASVVVLQQRDSVMVSFGITKKDGSYVLKRIPNGSYIFQATYIGFEPLLKDFEMAGSDLQFESIAQLDELVVTANRVPMIVSGDTLEYNAQAFKLPPNSSVEQLLKRLPGVEVERDGSIKAQGEDVEKVFVDGKEFFGNDPTIATKNLPADAVDKVQVYDKASDMAEFTGIEDGNEEKSINLQLKEDHKNGKFGYLQSGGGLDSNDPRYLGKASVNSFGGANQVSLIANINNVNQQGFSFNESLQFSGGMSSLVGGGGSFSLSTGGLPIGGSISDGYTNTLSGGLNLNRDFGSKTTLRSSYFFVGSDQTKDANTKRESIAGIDLATSNLGNSLSNVDSKAHNVDINLKHKFDPTRELQIRSNFKLGYNQDQQSRDAVNSVEGLRVNSTEHETSGQSNNLSGDFNTSYRQRFEKGGRNFAAEVGLNISDNDLEDLIDSENRFYDSFGVENFIETILQDQLGSNQVIVDRQKFSYTEPLGRKKYGEIHLERQAINDDQDRSFFDLLGGGRTLIDSLGSASSRSYTYYRPGLSFRRTGDLNVSVGVDYQFANLSGNIINRDISLENDFRNWLPSLNMNVPVGESSNLSFNYSTSTREPSLRDLQPFVDNRNPLYVYEGNPNLAPEYNHQANINFNWFDQFSFRSLFAYAYLMHSRNRITLSRSIDEQLRQFSSPVNSGNSNTVGFSASFGSPFRPLGIKFRIRNALNLTTGLELINSAENQSSNLNNDFKIVLENRNKEIFDIAIGPSFKFYRNSYSINEQLDRSYWNRAIEADFIVQASPTWRMESDLDYRFLGDELFTGKRSIPILNAGIYKTVYDGRAELSLVVKDALDQNQGINYYNQSTFVSEERINSLISFST